MNEDTDFIYDKEAEPNMRTALPSSPVSELVPVAWRARHSEQENWYLHTSHVGWWECQALVPAREAADRLTALEAENARLKADRLYVIGWNDGFDHAVNSIEFPMGLRETWSPVEVRSWLASELASMRPIGSTDKASEPQGGDHG